MFNLLRLAIVGCLVWFGATCSFAEEIFPSRTVRLVVPFPASGPIDLIARLSAQKMSELWARPVIVENRAGATGTIGTNAVVKAAPDGYTLLFTASQPIVIAPALIPTPYDPTRDLTPVAIVAQNILMLVAHPSSGVNSVAELVAAAKAKPGMLKYGSVGPGSLGHLCGELLKQTAGVDLTHVPYSGAAASTRALLSGEVSVACSAEGAPHVKAGKLKALALVSSRPSVLLPDIPPMSALGYKEVSVDNWFGVFAPLKVPRPTVQILLATLEKVFKDAGVRQKLIGAGIEPLWLEGDEVASRIQAELAKWRQVVQTAHITAN